MIRNLNALGLVLAAVLAMYATPASAATFRSEVEPTTLTGVQEAGKNYFEVDAGAIECDGITFQGTMSTKSENPIGLTPTYTKTCGSWTGQATFDMNGCAYRFTVTSVTANGSHGTFDIECTNGKEIKVTVISAGVLKCTIDIPAQNNISKVEYTNLSSGSTAEVTFAIATTSIKYTQTKGTGLGACSTTGLTSNGFYLDNGIIKGETDPGSTQKGIWIE